MTHIKCRYSIPYCMYHGRYSAERVYHDEFWDCDSNLQCEHSKYTKPDEIPTHNGYELANPRCVFCKYRSGEFEKSVKRYEYCDGTLKIGNDIYYEHDIDYLEIDGRLLVGEEVDHDETGSH